MIIEWFEDYADDFLQTHTDLGESQQLAETLTKEVTDFETSTQQILLRADILLQSASILETQRHTDRGSINALMGKIKQLMTDFDDRLGKRKKKIDESVQLQKLTELSLDWCIESAGLLSEFDLLSNSQDFDPAAAIKDINVFLNENPPPSPENQQALIDLAESTENLWAKQNALFAHNRVLEISERFSYHRQILENMTTQRDFKRTGLGIARVPVASNSNPTSPIAAEDKSSSSEEVNGIDRVSSIHDTMSDSMSSELDEPDLGRTRSLRSLRKQRESAKNLHLSSELLDLDEALSFLEEAVQSPEKIKTKGFIPSSEGSSPIASPEPQRLSKTDISGPTQPTGPLFSSRREIESPDLSESRWSLTELEHHDLALRAKNSKHRRQLMQELIDTEKAYIGHLEWVVENYVPAMDQLDELPRNLVGKKNIVFSNLQQLLEFNRQLILPQLEKHRKCPIKLGAIFLEVEEDFLNYSKYFKNMPHQTKIMEEGGIEFFASVQHKLKENYDLSSYLIKPFQRITKYKLFLADMIKHSSQTDYKGTQKDYFEQLKEAHKMIDFVLRHGNDLLAVDSLKGFEGSLREQGRILRQGELMVIEKHHKHKRRVFLFEQTIILAKTKRRKNQPEIPGSEVFEFRSSYKTSDFTLYESISGHPTRFELRKRKELLVFQAETTEEKAFWTQDVWDLYFSHMLKLKDQNLEAYGSRPLTSVVTSGMATLTRGRPLGHSMRKSLRYSGGQNPRNSREMMASASSSEDVSVPTRTRAGTYSPTPSTNRLSGTFHELRGSRLSACSLDNYSDVSSPRSSVISVSSSSTLTSLSLGETSQVSQLSPTLASPLPSSKRQSQLTFEVRRADGQSKGGEVILPPEDVNILSSTSSSTTSSLDNPEDTLTSSAVAVFDTPV